jgi:hypothetical protein
MSTITAKRKKRVMPLKKNIRKKKSLKKAVAKRNTPKHKGGYDAFKTYEGQQYTGMPVGRSHKWYYDKGDWRETKITPDLWEISYAVTKRRAGHAPEGTGVPTGTEYQWYIVAYQNVHKLNGDDYTTELSGLKFKLAHKRADKEKWNISSNAQRKKLIPFFREMIRNLQKAALKLSILYKDKEIEAEALPVLQSCHDDVCTEFDIFVGNRHLGIIKRRKSGWKMDNAKDEKFISAIGKAIQQAEA